MELTLLLEFFYCLSITLGLKAKALLRGSLDKPLVFLHWQPFLFFLFLSDVAVFLKHARFIPKSPGLLHLVSLPPGTFLTRSPHKAFASHLFIVNLNFIYLKVTSWYLFLSPMYVFHQFKLKSFLKIFFFLPEVACKLHESRLPCW